VDLTLTNVVREEADEFENIEEPSTGVDYRGGGGNKKSLKQWKPHYVRTIPPVMLSVGPSPPPFLLHILSCFSCFSIYAE
jgi:hypothetical protein